MSAASLICLAVIPSRIEGDLTGWAAERLEQVLVQSVVPAARAANMLVTRLDPSVLDDVAGRGVLDQVLLSDVAVFDVSDPSAEIAYLLGTRLMFRPNANVLLRQVDAVTPLKVGFDDTMDYRIGAQGGPDPALAVALGERFARGVHAPENEERPNPGPDYALYELVTDYRTQQISRTKTDEFRKRVTYSEQIKQGLAAARQRPHDIAIATLREIEAGLAPIELADSAVLVDLFLSYRAKSAWPEMARLFDRLPAALQRSTMLREQLAMALNRMAQRPAALAVLEEVEAAQGPSSESSALIGRVYKDLWAESLAAGDGEAAARHLLAAIGAYCRGFEADWRDAYPGINAVTLLDIHGGEESIRLRDRLLPVVRYAAEQRIARRQTDYWDQATLMELAVVEGDIVAARGRLQQALPLVRESWEPETTANNLRLLRRFRAERGDQTAALDGLIAELSAAAVAG